MTEASVTVNNLNQSQGSFNAVERTALFLGVGTANTGSVLSLNTQSDLVADLGTGDIFDVATAAKANGGQNWQGFAMPLTGGDDWRDALDEAIDTVDPEFVVLSTPMTTQAEIQDAKTKMEELRTSHAKRCQALIATPGIDSGIETWAVYEAAQITLQDTIAASRCSLVPQLHGNDLGVLAGRLCRSEVSIADSPQRVATGSIFGLGTAPVDSAGVALKDATLANLRGNRFNCIKRYTGLDGTYFGNFNTLDAEAGDYQNGEWLRLADKAARQVRILAIKMIDNRSINSSKVSQDYTKRYLMRPLKVMAKSATVNGVPFPGEIEKPTKDSIVINWVSKTAVEIYIALKPLDSPKTITVNILLDLSAPE